MGLYLETSPSGSRRWFGKYYFASKEKSLALGAYPAVSLKQTRSERDIARRTLQSGSNPSKRRQIERLAAQLSEANTFEKVARELQADKASGWSKPYGERWLERMEKDFLPSLDPVPLPEITCPHVAQHTPRNREAERKGTQAFDILLAFIVVKPIAQANHRWRLGVNEIYARIKGSRSGPGDTGPGRYRLQGLDRESPGHRGQGGTGPKLATRRLASGVVPELAACFAALGLNK